MQIEGVREDGNLLARLGRNFLRWFDTGPLEARDPASDGEVEDRVEWSRILPFVGMHLTCLTVVWVGWSPVAVLVAVGIYTFGEMLGGPPLSASQLSGPP